MGVSRAGLLLCARATAVVVAIAATTAQLVDFGVYGQRLQALSMMTHDSIFGAVSLGALGVAIVAAFGAALLKGDRRVEFAFLAVLLAMLLALRIWQPPHVLALGLPFSIAAGVLLWTVAPPGATRRLLREGCVVLVGAFVIHGVGAWVVQQLGLGPDTWGYQLKAVIKHVGELSGWIIVAFALTVVAHDRAGVSSRSSVTRIRAY